VSFKDQMNSDLDVLFSQSEFGETNGVIWNGTPVPHAIFDNDDVEIQMGEGVAQIMSQPVLTAKSSDFVGISDDDLIQIRGVTYYAKNWKDDGSGMIEIYLSTNPA